MSTLSDTDGRLRHRSPREDEEGENLSDTANTSSSPADTRDSPAPKSGLIYGVKDMPAAHITVAFAIQQLFAGLTGVISTTFLGYSAICPQANKMVFAKILSTNLVMTGISTFVQIAIGVRLPCIVGPGINFVPPILSMMHTDEWRCPTRCNSTNQSFLEDSFATDECIEPWVSRINEISGGTITASLVHMFVGYSGIFGFVMNYIGPLTVVPTITLVGLGVFEAATAMAQNQWGIAFLVVGLYVIFALVLKKVTIPLPNWNRSQSWHTVPCALFRLIPNFLAISIAWLLCYILTVSDVFPNSPSHPNYHARTDIGSDVVQSANWIYFPYPGQWGLPTFSTSMFVGVLTGVFASIIECTGAFYTIANVSQASTPPKDALNRGIGTIGFLNIFTGLTGGIPSTNIYSSSVGFIGITGVASRGAWVVVAVAYGFSGLLGKLAAVLSMIPDPVIGGALICTLALITAVGLAPLKHLEITSARNLLILGISLVLGMMLPVYLKDNPNIIQTGVDDLSKALTMLLGTASCVGGVTGFILDNIIPGSREERGLKHYVDLSKVEVPKTPPSKDRDDIYDLPFISNWLRRHRCCSFLPFMPSYVEPTCCKSRCTSCIEKSNDPPECRQRDVLDVNHTTRRNLEEAKDQNVWNVTK